MAVPRRMQRVRARSTRGAVAGRGDGRSGRGARARGAVGAPLALALLALLLSACRSSGTPAGPTPADFPGITRVLGPLGIAVSAIASGDAGCDDAHLAPTGISFQASGLDQPTPVPLHVYIFRDAAALERNLDAIDACARSFVTDPARYVKLQAPPYVLVGQGPWGERFASALRAGLETAASAGG